MLLRDVDLCIGRQSGSAANSNEKRKFHSREIDNPRPLLQQRADCLSRIYGSTWSHKSNGIVIFVGAHERDAPFAALTETEGLRNAGKNRKSAIARTDRQHASRVCSPDIHCVLRKWRALLRTRSISYLHP